MKKWLFNVTVGHFSIREIAQLIPNPIQVENTELKGMSHLGGRPDDAKHHRFQIVERTIERASSSRLCGCNNRGGPSLFRAPANICFPGQPGTQVRVEGELSSGREPACSVSPGRSPLSY